MAVRNVPISVTMAMVGHVSEEMTKHYTHIADTAQRRAVELLDEKHNGSDFGAIFGAKDENSKVGTPETHPPKLLN
jgi:hypothetical protein